MLPKRTVISWLWTDDRTNDLEKISTLRPGMKAQQIQEEWKKGKESRNCRCLI